MHGLCVLCTCIITLRLDRNTYKMDSINFDLHIDSDMYSFDVDEENAMETYKEVCLAYERIFKRLDLPAVKG